MLINGIPSIYNAMTSRIPPLLLIGQGIGNAFISSIKGVINPPEKQLDTRLTAEIRSNPSLAHIAMIEQTTSAADRFRMIGLAVTTVNNYDVNRGGALNPPLSLSASSRLRTVCAKHPLKIDKLKKCYEKRGIEFVKTLKGEIPIDATGYAKVIGLGLTLVKRQPLPIKR